MTASTIDEVDDQPTAWSREFYDDDALSSRSPSAPGEDTESVGLAARPAATVVGAAEEPGQVRRLTVADILRLGASDYVQAHRDSGACLNVQSVLAKLSLCRTRALGGRWFECDQCQAECGVYNSCGDRHCPHCSGAKRYNFSQRASSMFLEGVDYYQVVFTLPSELSKLALSNRQETARRSAATQSKFL